MLAAEGSFKSPKTWNPACRKASAVKNRWLLLAFAGTPSITSSRLASTLGKLECSSKLIRKAAHNSPKQLEHGDGLGRNLNQSYRAGPFQRPLERPDHRPARFFLRRPSLPSIDASLVLDGNQGREPFAG